MQELHATQDKCPLDSHALEQFSVAEICWGEQEQVLQRITAVLVVCATWAAALL